MVLEKITFNPRRSVLYIPDATKQMAQLTIENGSDQNVTFKMKSTRPGLFKMRPVFGTIAAGDKATVKLIFKGLKSNMKANLKERFTCVYTVAQGSTAKTAKIWKQHKHRQKIADSEMRKHKLFILYKGINDNLPMKEEGSEDEEEKKGTVIRRAPGAVEAEKAAEQPCSTRTAAEKAMPVVVMFRERPPASDESKSDDSDDEEKPGGEKSQFNDCVTAPIAANIKGKPMQVDLNGGGGGGGGGGQKKGDNDECVTIPLNDQLKGGPMQLSLNNGKEPADIRAKKGTSAEKNAAQTGPAFREVGMSTSQSKVKQLSMGKGLSADGAPVPGANPRSPGQKGTSADGAPTPGSNPRSPGGPGQKESAEKAPGVPTPEVQSQSCFGNQPYDPHRSKYA